MDDPQCFSSFQHFNEDTNNVNIFNCEFCEQTFNQQFDLQNHIFYNHEQELQNLKNSLNNDYPPSPEEEVTSVVAVQAGKTLFFRPPKDLGGL